MSKSKSGRVSLVGAGPGDPGLLTLKGARTIAAADVLVYDYLAAAPIVALAPPDCEKIYVGKKAGAHTLAQEEIAQLLIRLAREGKSVVRLKGGDPFVFGRGGEEADELASAGIAFEIVPGITSAIAAPAYAGIPLTHREYNTAFTIATGHEDPTKPESTIDYARLADPHQTLVFLMAMGNLAEIVGKLREHGLPGDRLVAIVREGTKPAQETLVATLDTIVAEAQRAGIAAPAIVVIGDVVRLRERIRWFDVNPLFGKRVLITRPAHQAASSRRACGKSAPSRSLAPTIAIGPPDDPLAARSTRSTAFATTTGSSSRAATASTHSSRIGARRPGRARVRRNVGRGDRTEDRASVAAPRHPPDFVPARVRQRSRRRRTARANLAERPRPALSRTGGTRRPSRAFARSGRGTSTSSPPTRPRSFATTTSKRSSRVRTSSPSPALRPCAASSRQPPSLPRPFERKTVAGIGPITADAARELGIAGRRRSRRVHGRGTARGARTDRLHDVIVPGALFAALIAAGAWRLRALDGGGAVAAFVVGTCTFAAGGIGGAAICSRSSSAPSC